MGYGNYSHEAHIAVTEARAGRSQSEVFTQGHCHPDMNPLGVKVRESRDSDAHPASVAIVFALDVSGSMGEVPHGLATRTMPTFMEHVTAVLPDAQVLFMAVGNAYTDRSPLQVGQFECDAQAMDRWLARIHLEGAGGGLCESYDLAMYFAARHTALDCDEKRAKKAYFFMTGDEPPFARMDGPQITRLLGDTVTEVPDIYAIVEELRRRYAVFFLIPDRARAAREGTAAVWTHLLHEACVTLDSPDDTAAVAALLVGITEGALRDEAAIRAHAAETMKLGEAHGARLARMLKGYAAAIAKGPLAAPTRMGERSSEGFKD
jgi:hypothetical protein